MKFLNIITLKSGNTHLDPLWEGIMTTKSRLKQVIKQ
jgi:hypothetical protein